MKNKKNKKSLLSFRTKAEAVLVVVLMVGIAVSSVMSGTITHTDKQTSTSDSDLLIHYEDGWINTWNMTIDNNSIDNDVINTWVAEPIHNDSDSTGMSWEMTQQWNVSDNNATKIGNSNGNYWSATGANIQLALDDGEVTVYLPTGNISCPKLTMGNRDRLVGQGNETILFRADGTDDELIENSDTTNGNYGITLENIRFEGNGEGQTPINPAVSYQGMIHFENCDDVTIKNCYINNSMNIGIYLLDCNNSRIIDNVVAYTGKYFSDNPTRGSRPAGIWMNNVNNSIVSRNIVRHTYSVGIAWSTRDKADWSHGWIVSDNIIYDCFAGIWAEPAEDGIISGNIISDCWNTSAYGGEGVATGIVVSSGCRKIKVIDNTIVGINHSGADEEGRGMRISGSYMTVSDNSVEDSDGRGIDIEASDSTVSYNIINNTVGIGLRLYNNRISAIVNIITNCFSSGIYSSATDKTAGGCILTGNIIIDVGGSGIYIVVHGSIVSLNSINNSVGAGIYNVGADNCIFSNNNITNSDVYGIRIVTGRNGSITGNIIGNCTDSGIYLQTASDNNTLIGNNMKDCANGIEERSSCSDNFIFGNNVKGNTGNAIDSSGTNTIIKDNIGYTTESTGLCTVLDDSTSIVVNHNMSIAPTIVLATPRDNMTSATFWYIDTVTATQFTLHVNNDVTADVSFYWKAEYN